MHAQMWEETFHVELGRTEFSHTLHFPMPYLVESASSRVHEVYKKS